MFTRYVGSINKITTRKIRTTVNNFVKTGHKDLANEHIDIPNRINRSPTDILLALSSTVGRDPTAAHYKYHDDPYLIPTSTVGKRVLAVAHESGRKAAKWVKEQHPDLFRHTEAKPPIKEFAPKMVFTEDSEVDLLTLKQLIEQSELNDAVLVYNLMKCKNMELTDDIKQSMLELICFYNNEEPLSIELIEERWFYQTAAASERTKKTWKDGDLAEKIFAEIEPKTPAAYAALIRGMSKYYQAERAFALLQEATENQMQLDTTTFNSVIAVSNVLMETADMRWEFCRDLLGQMYQQHLKPDLGTMNAVLETVSTFGNYKFARSCALKSLSEFKTLNIEPCLASYYFILVIFCRERSPVSHVIADILQNIQGQHFEIKHPKDTHFFTTAMDVCRNHLHDMNLARKVDELLHVGNNYDLIGTPFKEGIYYRHFFALLCQTESLEDFMKTYDLLVPNIYTPEPGIMMEILKAVEINAAIDMIPRFWSDMIIFDHIRQDNLIQYILKIMAENKPFSAELPSHKDLNKKFADIALDIFNRVEDQKPYQTRKVTLTGQMLGDILILLVRGDNFDKACEIFEHIDNNQHRIAGTPIDFYLYNFVDFCILNKTPSKAIDCLQYCVDNNIDSLAIAKKIKNSFTLNEMHLAKIKNLVPDCFEEKEK